MGSFPLSLVDELLNRLGRAKYVTTIHLKKNYWQIPFSEQAKIILSFITLQHLLYIILSFGLYYSGASFQHVINRLIRGLPGTATYISILVNIAGTREEYLAGLQSLFKHLSTPALILNLANSKLFQDTVTYLGHVVGSGQVKQ